MKRNLIFSLQAKQSLGTEELEISNSFFVNKPLFENFGKTLQLKANVEIKTPLLFSEAPHIEKIKPGLLREFREAVPVVITSEGDELGLSWQTERKGLPPVEVIFSYGKSSSKRTVNDFVLLFNSRFKSLEKILKSRNELSNSMSISRIQQKNERERVSIIGMVSEKATSKNNNMIFKLEDPTGTVSVIVSGKNTELFKQAKEICLDEVIGVVGTKGEVLFAQSLFYPDIPVAKELKKSPFEEYVVFVGDLHIGNKIFFGSEFRKMILWLKGGMGSEKQREMAKKVKYVVFIGDLVEGVGIYPNQEKDLSIPDVYDQYEEFYKYLVEIPKNIQVIIIPGNHDIGRISEPQPSLFFDKMQKIAELPNVLSLSNPCLIKIGAHKEVGFDGFEVLLYHGGSIPYYSENIPTIRAEGGLKRVDLIMKYLLQRRHLAPTHKSTIYVPDPDKDPLMIDSIPDIFVTGHIHKLAVSSYRNVTMINAACWVGMTDYMEKRGIVPDPGKLPVVNLMTREVKVMNFLSKESSESEGKPNTESNTED